MIQESANIGVELEDGSVEAIYCYSAASPQNMINTLYKTFPDGTAIETVKKYIDKGDRMFFNKIAKQSYEPTIVDTVGTYYKFGLREETGEYYRYLYTKDLKWTYVTANDILNIYYISDLIKEQEVTENWITSINEFKHNILNES